MMNLDSELSDDLPLSLPDESLSERLAALIDIIPPKTRTYLSSLTSSIYRTGSTGINYSGKGLWVVCSSVLLLGLPYALAFGGEQEMVEQERQQGMMAEGASVMQGGGEEKPAAVGGAGVVGST